MKSPTARFFGLLSPAAWVIVGLAAASSLAVALTRPEPRRGTQFWIFAIQEEPFYRSVVAEWNRGHPSEAVQLVVVNTSTLQQRMMSSFFSGTPIADMLEVERSLVGSALAGPLESVGFVDLTDRLRSQGLADRINAPSFSPWTSRGRIFGIPHDVHPVLLAYRADLVEAAGIDVSGIQTWDDYFRVMAPLMRSLHGGGRIDRYLINGWPSDLYTAEMLLLEAGGALFDARDRPTVDSDVNARIIARLATWYTGPHRVARSIDYFSASGHQMCLNGLTVGLLVPDWYAGLVMKLEMPGLAGRMKLMPLPAWEPGGRRTSVWGGTMLGIPRSSTRQRAAWDFAQHLYLSRETARSLFRENGIISPVKSNWDDPVYDQPDPYFCGQRVGRMFIDQAPSVPLRPSSPYNAFAVAAFDNCLIELTDYSARTGRADPAALLPEARRLLGEAQRGVQAQVARNVFLASP
jgi:arabinosaccharide transport system substrate-binding protein